MMNVEDTVLTMEEAIESEVKDIFGKTSFTKDNIVLKLRESIEKIKQHVKDESRRLITIPMIDFSILSMVLAKQVIISEINDKATEKLVAFFHGDEGIARNVLSIIEESLTVDKR